MKYVSIALFLFFLQVSMAVINATGILPTNLQPATEWFEAVDDNQWADQDYVQGEIGESEIGLGDFVKGTIKFVEAFGLGIVWFPYTLERFGITSPFIYYFGLPVYILYFLAIAQFISNRGTKGMR